MFTVKELASKAADPQEPELRLQLELQRARVAELEAIIVCYNRLYYISIHYRILYYTILTYITLCYIIVYTIVL